MPRLTERDREVEGELKVLAARFGSDAVRRAAKRLPIIRKPPRKRGPVKIDDEAKLRVMARFVSVGFSRRSAATMVALAVWQLESFFIVGGVSIPKPNHSENAIFDRLRDKFAKREQELIAEVRKQRRDGAAVPNYEQALMSFLIERIAICEETGLVNNFDRHNPSRWGLLRLKPRE